MADSCGWAVVVPFGYSKTAERSARSVAKMIEQDMGFFARVTSLEADLSQMSTEHREED